MLNRSMISSTSLLRVADLRLSITIESSRYVAADIFRLSASSRAWANFTRSASCLRTATSAEVSTIIAAVRSLYRRVSRQSCQTAADLSVAERSARKAGATTQADLHVSPLSLAVPAVLSTQR